MKKSEFKEYLKTEILKMNEVTDEEIKKQQDLNKELEKTKELEASMNEATDEEVKKQQDLNKELEKTKELTSGMKEGKVKKSEFKEYLRNEILREMNEAEEEEVDVEVDAEETTDPDAETFNFDEPSFDGGGDIDAITDELVKLAKDAKEAGQVELANQILNSAKFSAKTEFKKVEKEA